MAIYGPGTAWCGPCTHVRVANAGTRKAKVPRASTSLPRTESANSAGEDLAAFGVNNATSDVYIGQCGCRACVRHTFTAPCCRAVAKGRRVLLQRASRLLA